MSWRVTTSVVACAAFYVMPACSRSQCVYTHIRLSKVGFACMTCKIGEEILKMTTDKVYMLSRATLANKKPRGNSRHSGGTQLNVLIMKKTITSDSCSIILPEVTYITTDR